MDEIMKRRTLILPVLSLLFLGLGQAEAGLIAGPTTFSVVGGADTFWGIQFTALQNTTLTGFDYHHNPTTFGNPFTGTISLNDLTSLSTPYSFNYGVNSPTVLSLAPNVGLVSGHIYQLVASSSIVSGGNDEVYEYITTFGGTAPAYPASNSDISVTQGAFSSGGFQNSSAWGAFSNIATAQAVPEPAALGLFALGLTGLAGHGWRRRDRRPA
jgi:hypothetical protein